MHLYTKPKTRIPVYFSAMGPKAAEYAARAGDHLITIVTPDRCKNVIFPPFEDAARKVGKEPGNMERMVPVLFMLGNRSDNLKLLKAGHAGMFVRGIYDESDPRRIESSAARLNDDIITRYFNFCDSIDNSVDIITHYQAVGVNHVALGIGASPERIRLLADRILPRFR